MKEQHAERVAAEVRASMARTRTSQTVLATALGLSQAAVSRRLVGAVPFDIAELYIVADVLGVEVTTFLPASVPARSAS